jgi:hypothetical protein
MLPDRADTTAIIEEAVTQAAEYWGTEHDQEAALLAALQQQGVHIKRNEFAELVEAKIAITWADQHADLSRYGWADNEDWPNRAEFIRQQREEWYAPTLDRVVCRTRETLTLTHIDDLAAA